MNVTSMCLDRFYALGLPNSVAHNLRNQIEVWIKSCGEEWTVNRLKDLKTMYIHKLSGTIPQLSSWIATDREGNPKGPFGWLFRRKVSRRVFSSLLAYTAFVAKTATKRQLDKFIDSVQSPDLDRLPHIPHLQLAVQDVVEHLPRRKVPPFETFGWSPLKRAPKADMTTCPEGPDVLFEDFSSTIVWDLLDDDEIQGVLSETLGSFYPMLFSESEEEVSSPFGKFAGRISAIQEPGFKLRAIANPRRIFQVALRPLGMQLFHLLRHLPWDCTYDQESGVRATQEALQAGKVVHCIDLSDATNNFPLSLQLRILRWMEGLHLPDLKLFEEVAKAPWFLPPSMRRDNGNSDTENLLLQDDSNGPEEPIHQQIRWTKGQPLGLYPSFPSFALTHGLLLRSIEIGSDEQDTFKVLGDDVVIFDDHICEEYLKFLRLLRVPISESKSIHSDRVAEFGGMVITKQTVLKSWKWRLPRDENRMSLTMSLPRIMDLSVSLDFCSYLVRNCPYPIGTGENPEGVPLEERVKMSLPVILDWKSHTDTLRLKRHSLLNLWRETRSYVNRRFIEVGPGERERLDHLLNLAISKWEAVHPFSPQGVNGSKVDALNVLARVWDRLGILEGVYPTELLPLSMDWRDSYSVATAIQSKIRDDAEKRFLHYGFLGWKKRVAAWQERIYLMSRRTLAFLIQDVTSEILLNSLEKDPKLTDRR